MPTEKRLSRPAYTWRRHLAEYHGLDPESYDVAELVALHTAAHDHEDSAPHEHGGCPRCGIGDLAPQRRRATLGAPVALTCDTCDTIQHAGACDPPRSCRCGLNPYPTTHPDHSGDKS